MPRIDGLWSGLEYFGPRLRRHAGDKARLYCFGGLFFVKPVLAKEREARLFSKSVPNLLKISAALPLLLCISKGFACRTLRSLRSLRSLARCARLTRVGFPTVFLVIFCPSSF